MERVKTGLGGWVPVLNLILTLALIVFAAGAWRGNADTAQVATAREVAALSAQIESLKKEVTNYAKENQQLHATLAEQFVTRREWLMLIDHTARPK